MSISSIVSLATESVSVPENVRMRFDGLMKDNLKEPNKSLKSALFLLCTQHLYPSLPIPLSLKSIVVMGRVLEDGNGDYYHIVKAAEQIKAAFPDVDVTMLVSHHEAELPNRVRKPLDSRIKVVFCNSHPIYTVFYTPLKCADQIIEISHGICEHKNSDDNILAIIKEKGDRYRYIVEYGMTKRGGATKGMGLQNWEFGIFIDGKPTTSSMLDLENGELKQLLFGTKNPIQSDLENYLKTNEPFIGYLKMGSYYQMGLIYTIAAYLKTSEKKTIDLMIPPVKMEYLDTEFLKGQGIGKIKIIKKEKDHWSEEEILLGEGKELRFIHPFPLEQKDFYVLMAHTNPLVGCTGDHSFSEVISFDRLPFYEVRAAKVWLISHLAELAERVGKEPHYLKQYLQELASIHDEYQTEIINIAKLPESECATRLLIHFKEKQPQIAKSALKIAHLLQQPELLEEAHALNALLRSQYSFNPTLLAIVQRQFALNSYPKLHELEAGLQKSYLEDSITLAGAQKQLIESISSLLSAQNLS